MSLLLSLAANLLWIAILWGYTERAVKTMVTVVPLTLLSSAIFMVYAGFTGVYWVSIPFALLGIASLAYMMTIRNDIQKVIYVLELAFRIIQSNPLLILVSVVLEFVSFGISYTFYLNVIRGFSSYTIYSIFMFMWTASILENTQKATISNIVYEWYFGSSVTSDEAIASLKKSFRVSFGTISFVSLIQGYLKLLSHTLRAITRREPTNNFISRLASNVATSIKNIVNSYTSYILIYSVFTNSSFLTSATEVYRLFSRNLILGLLTNTISYVLLMSGSIVASSASVLLIAYITKTYHIFAWLVVIHSSKFIVQVILNIINVVFVCYVLDLDVSMRKDIVADVYDEIVY
jgi:hypothetical protein